MKGLFVTGTDTGVGKTVAAAALLQRYRGVAPLRYWKPIQTGIEIDDDTATVRRLGAAAAPEIFEEGVRLEKPVSPHLAARWAGTRIDLAELRALLPDEPDTTWIVEGAGGLPHAADAGGSANALAAGGGRGDDRRAECGKPRCY
jgi:dethiobiotin synthase